MKLKRLYLSRSWDGKQVTGDVQFSGELGTVELKLDDAACKSILEICAETLVAVSKEVATELTRNCIDAVPPVKLVA